MTTDPMTEIRTSFFVECEDLIESLQDALSLMEGGASDSETVNVVFRAVHSIKGGAGAFGLEALVDFAHRFETVLDELRSGRISADAEAVRLFFQAADVLQDHVRAARDDTRPPDASEATLTAVEALLGEAIIEDPPATLEFSPQGLSFDFTTPDYDGTTVDNDVGSEAARAAALGAGFGWVIRLSPRAGLYQSGNETGHLLRGLSALAEARIECAIPSDLELTEDCAESPRLSWTICLLGDLQRSEIEDLFDFVADVCDIEIDEGATLASSKPKLSQSDERSQALGPGPDTFAASLTSIPQNNAVLTQDAPPAANPHSAPGRFGSDPAPATVRVDLEKIDRLVNLVGELVINQAMLSQSVNQAGLSRPEITAGLEASMALTRDIQDSVMSVRAQPVKPLFQRMARIVREASSSVKKSVRLRTEGDATEVDKTVIERLADPLTHIIRNAVDHGLESPEARIAAGKPREGQITLSALHRAGRILIEIADDGAGINREKVLSIAVSRGLVAPDATLTESEIDQILFLPGFSTADKVSALSGRGVGMDVVKSAIAALGGRISISSEADQGTKLSISLPLTLAVLDGMVVSAAEQTFVIPLSAIIETAKLSTDLIKRVGGQMQLLHIRGDLIPLVDLGTRLGFRRLGQENYNGIVIITAQDNGGKAALIVDSIMEQRQVVIKGLGTLFGPMPGVAAATILGDGQIALILDPADLIHGSRTVAGTDLAIAG